MFLNQEQGREHEVKQFKSRKVYFHSYYLKNRQRLLSYSKEVYQVKKLIAPFLEKKINSEKGVKKSFSSHTRINITIARKIKNFFLYGMVETNQRELGTSQVKLERRLDQPYLRLATRNKMPTKKGWTYPNWKEWLNKEQLLKRNGEWSLRGGQKIGNKYLSFLDLDVRKEKIAFSLQKQLEKNTSCLLDYLKCFRVETRKGYHVYLLTDEFLPNQILYHTDKFGKRRIIGSIQSKGKYVVGFDSVDKRLVAEGRWFWHAKSLEEVEEKLGKFFVELGEKVVRGREESLIKEISVKIPTEFLQKLPLRLEKDLIQAKILSKHKTSLPDIWKVFYLNQLGNKGYFLLNSYQKSDFLPNLRAGTERNINLVQGRKHVFLVRCWE